MKETNSNAQQFADAFKKNAQSGHSDETLKRLPPGGRATHSTLTGGGKKKGS